MANRVVKRALLDKILLLFYLKLVPQIQVLKIEIPGVIIARLMGTMLFLLRQNVGKLDKN